MWERTRQCHDGDSSYEEISVFSFELVAAGVQSSLKEILGGFQSRF